MIKIDHIYCINLEKDTIRKEYMEKQLNREFPNRYSFFKAKTISDIKELNQDIPEKYNFKNDYQNIENEVHKAINLSHYYAVKEFYESEYELSAICEDDVHLYPNIEEQLNTYIKNSSEINPTILDDIKNKPTIIRLGSGLSKDNQTKKPKLYVKNKIKGKTNIMVWFYIINKEYAKKFMEYFFPMKNQIDTYTHILSYYTDIKDYTTYPILCYDISSTFYKHLYDDEDKDFYGKIWRYSIK